MAIDWNCLVGGAAAADVTGSEGGDASGGGEASEGREASGGGEAFGGGAGD